MATSSNYTDLKNPDSTILDIDGLAALLGISAASIPAQRSRSPEKLPPPFLSRPLRWRRETVVRWMDQQEASARAEAESGALHSGAPKRVHGRKALVHRVWGHPGPRITGRTPVHPLNSASRRWPFFAEPPPKSARRSRRLGRGSPSSPHLVLARSPEVS